MNMKKEVLKFKDLKGYAGIKMRASNNLVYMYIIPDDPSERPDYYEFENLKCKKLHLNKWVDKRERNKWPRKSVRSMGALLQMLADNHKEYELYEADEIKKLVFMAIL